MNPLTDCTLCPRDCHVDRTKRQTGYCGMTDEVVVARAALHLWEEPCISGKNGSGTVFFSGCALKCAYCQNYKIAQGFMGKAVDSERLSQIFLELQEEKAHNINLVTPSHFVPQIISAIRMAKDRGLCLPIVYNSSGYEKVETLKLLAGYVDIYLPDFKYWSGEIAQKYSHCADYFIYASAVVEEMLCQVGAPVFDADGLMKKGVIVRHLVIPRYLDDSKAILKYLYETFGDRIWVSIMNQYTPMPAVKAYPELNRKITQAEYDEVIDYALALGIRNGFIQEGETASESFIPEFDTEGV